MFKKAQEGSRRFKQIPEGLKKCARMHQKAQKGSIGLGQVRVWRNGHINIMKVNEGSRRFQMLKTDSRIKDARRFQKAQNGSRWLKMAQEGSRRFKKVQEGSRRFNKVPGGLRMLKKVQECQKRKDSKSFKLYNCLLILLGSK